MQKYKINNLLKIKHRAALCRALSDAQRWLIVEFLLQSKRPRAVGEVAARLKIADATVSHHLRQLELAGLISRQRRGRFIYCRVRINALSGLAQLFTQLSGQAYIAENAEPQQQWSGDSLVWN